jgi:short-subunit dehydrogenase
MKKILITGCSSGFGYISAKHLAKKGHFIYASMRNIHGKNSKTATELTEFAKANDCKIEIIEMDVTSDESVLAAISKIPKLDVLINNAGLGFSGPVEAFSSEECLAQLDLNIVGPLRVSKAVLPNMRSQKSGLIIQVSSISGRSAFPGFGVYSASKWGLEGMSETMRYELAPLGVDVVIVEPGPFSTNFSGNVISAQNDKITSDYKHLEEFGANFSKQLASIFEDENSPTNPILVAEAFDTLINSPVGTRPLRTIVGLDFGTQAVNDAVEPIRKTTLKETGMENWDGPLPE